MFHIWYMQRIAIFPGSFDPFTVGHADIAQRGANVFDKLIIAFGKNTNKQRYIPIEQVTDNVNDLYKNNPKIEVQIYEGLTANFAKKVNANFLVRGLRNTTDFEYENTISQGNKHLNSELETVFLITDPKLAYISSSIVREIHRHGGDVTPFLPYSL